MIYIVTGQTATGKTKLALELAKKNNGELINCDSRQIYKHLDIITGKDLNLLKNTKIWLYDIIGPKQYFSSFDYQQQALDIIKDILIRKKTPIIIGGTYFYLYHLLYKVETETIPPDWELRNTLNNKSIEYLQNIYRKLNVQSFNQLNNSDKNNPQRLIRRIEIATQPPRQPSRLPRSLKNKLCLRNLDIKFIGLKYKNKTDLINAIEIRVEERLNNGAIEEVKSLLKRGYTATDPGLKTIGYNQIIRYLNGEITKQEAINEWILRETQYSKRQYTFMKKDKNIQWREV